jgi:hypothetical protein
VISEINPVPHNLFYVMSATLSLNMLAYDFDREMASCFSKQFGTRSRRAPGT